MTCMRDIVIGQVWCHKRYPQAVTIVNIYRKDGTVMVDNDDTGGRYIVPIRRLVDNFEPRDLWITPSTPTT